MKIVTALAIAFGCLVLLTLVIFVTVVSNMVFIARMTERRVLAMEDYEVLLDGVTVTERPGKREPLPFEYRPDAGAIPAARTVLLTPEGFVREGARVFDSDPDREVLQLDARGARPTRVFSGTEVHTLDGDRLGEAVARFPAAPFEAVRYVGGIDDTWFLVAADLAATPHVEIHLWQVRHDDLTQQRIETDPYFTFSRPPKTFAPPAFPGTLVAIYQGSMDYGFGGDSSRPKYSILRAYTPQHPDGIDLARFSLRGGTVVDVHGDANALLVTTDPSRPQASEQPARPPREWRLELPADL